MKLFISFYIFLCFFSVNAQVVDAHHKEVINNQKQPACILKSEFLKYKILDIDLINNNYDKGKSFVFKAIIEPFIFIDILGKKTKEYRVFIPDYHKNAGIRCENLSPSFYSIIENNTKNDCSVWIVVKGSIKQFIATFEGRPYQTRLDLDPMDIVNVEEVIGYYLGPKHIFKKKEYIPGK